MKDTTLEIMVLENRTELGRLAASRAKECIVNAIAQNGSARIIVATGSSQFEVLDSLTTQDGIDWTRVDGFHLDEYIGLDRSHPASFCGYLSKRFVDRIPIRSFQFLEGTGNAQETCDRIGKLLTAAPIDLALVGIGENGHLAFNDPPADFETETPYLIVDLDEACRKQQVGEGWFDRLDLVPTKAMSMSVKQIMKSKKIICSVPDRRKADAVFASIEGEVTPRVPASILQQHSSVVMLLDQGSGEKLDPRFRVKHSS